MYWVGLTGGIGAGKSTVAALLAERGAVVIDADALAREVVQPGTAGFAAVVDAFGAGVLAGNGALDRKALAALVFADDGQRARLNAVVHPLVAEATRAQLAALPPGAIAVHDIPLLVEVGAGGYDLVVTVEAPQAVRLRRLAARGLDETAARARMAAQASERERVAAADVVISNAGSYEELALDVDRLWGRITG